MPQLNLRPNRRSCREVHPLFDSKELVLETIIARIKYLVVDTRKYANQIIRNNKRSR